MTDQQTYTHDDGSQIRVKPAENLADQGNLFISASYQGNTGTVFIAPAKLLAMIDAADPDAMRAYLRETAPEVIADLYRPAPAAADHFDYLDTVPEGMQR